MVYSSGDALILAVVRGDQEVSPEKLQRALGCGPIRLAEKEELEYYGILGDFVSPIQLPLDLLELDVSIVVVVDEVVADTPNLVIACNEEGVHLTNINFGRDFESDSVHDISRVLPGARCKHCGSELQRQRVTEVGHVFNLGDYYSRRMKFVLSDRQGRKFYPAIGAYGIGLGRLMAAVVEANHDHRGIVWPPGLAPYRCYLMSIGKSAKLAALADEIHEELGDEVLYDDRKESISTKFKDADLIGVPYRVILSPRSAEQGQLELLERRSGTLRRIPIEGARRALDDLEKESLKR
jgi:prolyl-tRNA synthetase